MRWASIFLAFLPYVAVADESPKEFGLELMVLSKFTGLCGSFTQMVAFQEATQMQGGYEFLNRFWATESARLGMTMEEFGTQCGASIKRYHETYNILESN